MIRLTQLFRVLRPIRHAVVDHALVEALSTTLMPQRRDLVEAIVQRGTEVGFAGLLHSFHLLDPALQEAVLEQREALDGAIRRVAGEDEPQARLNIIDLIVRTRAFRLAYVLSAQLHYDEARVTRAAAQGLLDLAHWLTEHPGELGMTPTRAHEWLGSAIAEACSCYHQHGRNDVLRAAALIAPRRHRRLLEQLTDRRLASHRRLCELMRRSEYDTINRALLMFAGLAALQPATIETLRKLGFRTALPQTLRLGYLILNSDVRRIVGRITKGDHLLPTADVVPRLSDEAARQAPRWIASVSATRIGRITALAELLQHDDALTRLLALRTLMRIDDLAVDEAIATACFDAAEPVAVIALRHLRRRRWAGLGQTAVKLLSSPHPRVRRLAERDLAPIAFARYWDHWDRMDPATRTTAGRALIKLDRRFHEHLAERMTGAAAGERLRAIMIARHLEIAGYFEEALTTLAGDDDDRVASAATRALGAIADSPAAAERVERALHDTDDRVRANAIEAIDEMAGEEPLDVHARAALEALTDAPGPRSRANAIAALHEGEADAETAETLTLMLRDVDVRHRLSALWVVKELELTELFTQIAEMAQSDPDIDVRQRALSVLRHWTASPPQRTGVAAGAGDEDG